MTVFRRPTVPTIGKRKCLDSFGENHLCIFKLSVNWNFQQFFPPMLPPPLFLQFQFHEVHLGKRTCNVVTGTLRNQFLKD